MSCDTEDWSNDAENTALHHRNKLHFNVITNINGYNISISKNCIIDQINAALEGVEETLKNKEIFQIGNVVKITFETIYTPLKLGN